MANIAGTALATTRNLRNYLRNGSFSATPTVETPIYFEDAETVAVGVPTMGIGMHTVSVADPGIVYRPAADPYLAYWTIAGDGTYFDVNPIINGKRYISLDGGNLLRCGFSEDATATVTQTLPGTLLAMRGQPITAALTVVALAGTARVRMSAEFGTGSVSSVVVSSANAAAPRRIGLTTEVPLNATQVNIVITVSGERGSAIGVAGVTLVMGAYKTDIPYSDNPLDGLLPPGSTIMYAGTACPPGFRRVADATGAIPYLVPGTPGQMNPIPRTEADVDTGPAVNDVVIYDRPTFAVGTNEHTHKIDGAFGGKPYWDWTEFRNQAPRQLDPDTGEDVRTGTTVLGYVTVGYDLSAMSPVIGVTAPRVNPEPFVAAFGETMPGPTSPRATWPEILPQGHKHNITIAGESVPPFTTLLLCERI